VNSSLVDEAFSVTHKKYVVLNFFSCIIAAMKTHTVEITLAELQAALREYCLKHGHNPSQVAIVSYAKTIVVELEPNGLVTAEEFKHRA
jgi:hypothetical protein